MLKNHKNGFLLYIPSYDRKDLVYQEEILHREGGQEWDVQGSGGVFKRPLDRALKDIIQDLVGQIDDWT